jgi:hypothetical protein
VREGVGQPVDGGGVGAGVERVAARVAGEDDRLRGGYDALRAVAQQLLGLELVVGALERLDVLASLAARSRSRRAWRSTTIMPKARMPPPNRSTKANTIQRACCSSASVRRSRWRLRAASWVRRRSMSALRVRASAMLAAFGPVRST